MQTNKRFEEAIKTIGGLSEADRMLPGIHELVPLAAATSTKFREATNGGSIKQWWRACQESVRALREANAETALGFLLRKGVQTIANDWYQVTNKEWPNYCLTASSTTIAEWYAPLYPSVIADRVQAGVQFPEGRIIGEDSHLVNQKFGLIEAIDQELISDDQSGQIKQRAQRLGQSMSITESVWAASRFVGTERTYANLTVPASSYSTTDINGTAVSTPFSTTLYGASAGNALQSYGTLNMGHLKQAYVQLLNAVDPLQNKIIVNPSCLLVSSQDAINGKLLLAEGGYPAIVGQSDAALASNPTIGGTSATAGASQGAYTGFPGGFGSNNPFSGLGIKLIVERYMTDWVWALGEAKKGLVFQERDPMEVVQESPNTGSSFNFDQVRFRSRRRFECDWVGGGSRFFVLGNDGSVTGNQ
jgi:hypothetical protein